MERGRGEKKRRSTVGSEGQEDRKEGKKTWWTGDRKNGREESDWSKKNERQDE